MTIRRVVVLRWTETVRGRAWVAGDYRVVRGLDGFESYFKGGGELALLGVNVTPEGAKRRCRNHAERPRP